ncbi:MAG: hypothetical protein KDE45_20550, partial [Caldilineaceae bacterium]|nr:hypothetical protein [Caldilineaceae bacterium]
MQTVLAGSTTNAQNRTYGAIRHERIATTADADVTMVKTTILLADDDEMIVDVLRHQLEREGFAVLATGNGLD